LVKENNMAVSNTSGKTYDIAEYGRLDAFIKEQQAEMDKIDLEKSVQNKKILQYGIVLTGVVLTLYLFSRLVNRKK
jgi:hypothetical protein